MKVFFGEKTKESYDYVPKNSNIIYTKKNLFILSEEDFTEIFFKNNDQLILWGNIVAIINKKGKYQPVDLKTDGQELLEKIFREEKFEDIIKNLEGKFIGCLIKSNNDVIIFSDSFNRRDIFYSLAKNELIASTDLSAVISRDNISYNQAALANILSIMGGYAPKKHTIYNGILRLGVGERLAIRKGRPSVEKIPFSPLKIRNYGPEELEEYSNILEDAVKIRGSDNTNWIYLSSGWDSTGILGILVKIYGASNVKAVIGKMVYSSRAKDINRFEIERAKKVADYYSVDLEIIPFDYTKNETIKAIDEIRPFLKNNHIPFFIGNFQILSKYMKENISQGDAVFCGEISDGAHNFGFSQYTTILEHPVLEFREYSDKMATFLFGPTFFKSILDGSYSKDAVYKLLRSRLEGHTFEDEQPLDKKRRIEKFISSMFIRNHRIPFYSLDNMELLTTEGANMYESEMFKSYFKDCTDNLTQENLYSWILYLYNSFHWQGSTVKGNHEMARYYGFTQNFPFWDIRLQRFLSGMPENWGRGLEMRPTKYPLKWMLKNKIDYPIHLQVGPHSYTYDVDPGFSLIGELVHRSAYLPHLQETIKDYPFESLLDRRYFNFDYYRKLVDDYLNGVIVTGQKLSDLRSLLWLCWIGWY
jgi:hypothetical protein